MADGGGRRVLRRLLRLGAVALLLPLAWLAGLIAFVSFTPPAAERWTACNGTLSQERPITTWSSGVTANASSTCGPPRHASFYQLRR